VVPGPPLMLTLIPTGPGGGAGLTDATSNVGPFELAGGVEGD
jgi:hypothetical protein